MINNLINKILIFVNGSQASIDAAEYGIMMSKLFNCQLKAVYVVDIATIKELTLRNFFIAEEGFDYEQMLTQDGSKYLNYVDNLAKSKGIKIETELRKGAIWSEVISCAEDIKADVILLGQNVNEHSKDVINSSNREIIENASCSVFVVKQKNIEQLFKLT